MDASADSYRSARVGDIFHMAWLEKIPARDGNLEMLGKPVRDSRVARGIAANVLVRESADVPIHQIELQLFGNVECRIETALVLGARSLILSGPKRDVLGECLFQGHAEE